MDRPYWVKQSLDKPTYQDLIWSRPDNRRLAGDLLIIGGHAQSFAAPAEAYSYAIKSGIGKAHILMPDSLEKTVSKIFPGTIYGASSQAGSLGRESLGLLLEQSKSADAVLLAGDFGHNSETAILLERFIEEVDRPVVITKDAIDYLYGLSEAILNNDQIVLVASFAQMHRLINSSKFGKPLLYKMELLNIVEFMHELSLRYSAGLVIKVNDFVIVADKGNVSTTKLPEDIKIWRLSAAASIATWWLQNPCKRFEALTSALTIFSD